MKKEIFLRSRKYIFTVHSCKASFIQASVTDNILLESRKRTTRHSDHFSAFSSTAFSLTQSQSPQTFPISLFRYCKHRSIKCRQACFAW